MQILSTLPSRNHRASIFHGAMLTCACLAASLFAASASAAGSAAASASAQSTASAHRAHRSKAHTRNAAKKTEASQAPQTPPTPPPPDWPANDKPNPAAVVWDSAGLRINASNSSLHQILSEISTETGTKVEGSVPDQRVYGDYGPGQARDVLADLLVGSGFNVLLAGDLGHGAPREIVLSPRKGGSPNTQNNANRPQQDPDDEIPAPEEQPEEQPQPVIPPPPQPEQQQPQQMQNNFRPGFGPNGPIRTPQQVMEEMQQRQMQQEQQMQQQQQQNQTAPQANPQDQQ